MSTIMQETASADVTTKSPITTHCYAAELVWDAEMAARFRELMVMAVGRDCFCHEGESCWLMDTALKGVRLKSGEYVSLFELAAPAATV